MLQYAFKLKKQAIVRVEALNLTERMFSPGGVREEV